MTETYWYLNLAPVPVVAAILLLLVSIALAILQVRWSGKHARDAWTEVARCLAIALLAFTFLRPEKISLHREDAIPALGIMLDVTGSMETTDTDNGQNIISRAQWVTPLLQEDAWAALARQYRIQLVPFGSADASPDTEEEPKPEQPQQGTDLHTPLDDWARRPEAARALIMVSDGDWTTGPDPIEAATRLLLHDTPLFTVTVGSDQFLPDLELLPVRAPAFTQIQEQAHLAFVVQSRMPHPVETTAILLENGQERARMPIRIPAMAQYASSITFVPDTIGDFLYQIQILAVPGEQREDNNMQSFGMSVRSETINILIIDTEPRWEYRYLRNAALRDPYVDVHTLLLHPGMDAGRGLRYLPAFPETREALARYDVVFLGDVGMGPDGLTEEQCRQLRELVATQASGLVFLPGPAGRWISLADGPLGDLLPVEIEKDFPRGHGIDIPGRMALTTLGRDHRLTRLAPTPEQTLKIWENLPGFYWYAGIQRARPGSEILAVHANARNADGRIPLLVASRFQSGKVLFMGHDAAWRWRRGVEDLYHYRFWSQVFRWMAHQRHIAHADGIRFFFNPESPLPGDRLWVHATALDEQGFPMQGATVEGVLHAPSGQAYSFHLPQQEEGWGTYQGYAPVRETGSHDLIVRVRETSRQTAITIHVAAPDLEPVGRPAKHEVLRELAAITGGQAFRTADLDQLIQTLQDLPARKPRESRFRLWSHPAWLTLLVAAFSLYWIMRKAAGRI